jgi:hypothetical protein
MSFLPLVLVLASSAGPDLSGTWKLDAGRSRITTEVGWPGLIGSGAPEKLHITHAANGTVVIESEINESHARIYKPGGAKTVTPVAVTGSITMTSRWEGLRLASEGSLTPPSGPPSTVRETLALSGDGRTLTVEIETTGPSGSSASGLTYVRTDVVDPCEKWPTPCKPPGS